MGKRSKVEPVEDTMMRDIRTPPEFRAKVLARAEMHLLEFMIMLERAPKARELHAKLLQVPLIAALVIYGQKFIDRWLPSGHCESCQVDHCLPALVISLNTCKKEEKHLPLFAHFAHAAWAEYGVMLLADLDEFWIALAKHQLGACLGNLCFNEQGKMVMNPVLPHHGQVCTLHQKNLRKYRPFSDASPQTLKSLKKIFKGLPMAGLEEFSGFMHGKREKIEAECHELRKQIITPE